MLVDMGKRVLPVVENDVRFPYVWRENVNPRYAIVSLKDSMQGTRPSKTTLETYSVLKLRSLIHIANEITP